MHYSSQLDEQFTVVFMTVSHSPQMLSKLEKCIPISHVTLETVPKYANIERPTSSQLYASCPLELEERESEREKSYDEKILKHSSCFATSPAI